MMHARTCRYEDAESDFHGTGEIPRAFEKEFKKYRKQLQEIAELNRASEESGGGKLIIGFASETDDDLASKLLDPFLREEQPLMTKLSNDQKLLLAVQWNRDDVVKKELEKITNAQTKKEALHIALRASRIAIINLLLSPLAASGGWNAQMMEKEMTLDYVWLCARCFCTPPPPPIPKLPPLPAVTMCMHVHVARRAPLAYASHRICLPPPARGPNRMHHTHTVARRLSLQIMGTPS